MVPLNSHEFAADSNRLGYNHSEPSKQVKKFLDLLSLILLQNLFFISKIPNQ